MRNVDYVFNGRALLAGVLGWGQAHLERIIEIQDVYAPHSKKKKSGGVRTISVPHKKLLKFQRRLLGYFFYRIFQQGWMDRRIHGFLPAHSTLTNARVHLRSEMQYVVRMDLKDAFPSVSPQMVRAALWKILAVEVLQYRLAAFPRPPLFSTRKTKWFRRLFKKTPPIYLKKVKPLAIIDEFLDALLPLVTHDGGLPQGAPTSPFLLNLVLSHYGIPGMAEEWFGREGRSVCVSVYADDFTVSSATPFSREEVEEFMVSVERLGVFCFNRAKVVFFDRRQVAPLVTGLRLVRTEKGDAISVPKKQLRKIRGLIYRAIIDEKLRVKAKGYVDYLHGIYGPVLPPQVAVPWEKLRWRMN